MGVLSKTCFGLLPFGIQTHEFGFLQTFVSGSGAIAISQNREIGHGKGKTEYHLTLDLDSKHDCQSLKDWQS